VVVISVGDIGESVGDVVPAGDGNESSEADTTLKRGEGSDQAKIATPAKAQAPIK
jgi:hypothetical protein